MAAAAAAVRAPMRLEGLASSSGGLHLGAAGGAELRRAHRVRGASGPRTASDGKRIPCVRAVSFAPRWSPALSNRSVRLQAMGGESVTIRSVPVAVAKELLDAGHRYVDVRTPEEFAAGHVPGAINIPIMFKQGAGMTANKDFVAQVQEQFENDHELVLGCKSGRRSLVAINELHSAGFTACTDLGGGFDAWMQSGLPHHVA